MFNLEINNNVYSFNFSIGFVRKINAQTVQMQNGIKKEVGLQMAVAGVMDRDPIDICNVLLAANEVAPGAKVTRTMLDNYLDDESTDIDTLCDEIVSFFENSNATKRAVAKIREILANQ